MRMFLHIGHIHGEDDDDDGHEMCVSPREKAHFFKNFHGKDVTWSPHYIDTFFISVFNQDSIDHGKVSLGLIRNHAMHSPRVIFENAHVIALNKHPNASFHSSKTSKGYFQSMKEALMDERSLTGNKAVSNLYPVHRLDSITSGVLLCAKSKEVAEDMGALFESHSVHKYVTSIYIYIVSSLTGTTSLYDMMLQILCFNFGSKAEKEDGKNSG